MPTTSGTDPTGRLRAFGRAVVDWGRTAGPEGTTVRPDLPWRTTRDPWAVLVSEVMAQQTQLTRVVPAYHRFLARFPTPADCAAAPLGEVLVLWEGLGYNRRARNLHRAAVAVVDRHGGRVPDALPDLLALPGVGPYTARAVAVFAHGAPFGVVDTNSGRVLARAVAGAPVRPARAQTLVDAMVPDGDGWAFGQSLLDLGALVCTARDPDCGHCPVRRRCAWARAGFPPPDPATGSAGVSVVQSAFAGSDRQGRGRLVDALRRGPLAAADVAAVPGWEDDPGRVERIVGALVAEGLAVRTDGGGLALP